jgi:GDP-L-fucose synthase
MRMNFVLISLEPVLSTVPPLLHSTFGNPAVLAYDYIYLCVMRVTVTGAAGFLGRHLVPVLQRTYPSAVVATPSRKQYDLTKQNDVRNMLQDTRPNVLIHLAAYVGGIGANREFPADFFYRNLISTALVFEEASRYGLRKLIYPMGGCSYPANATSPIDERQMWEGYPQPESAPYSIAKKTALVASEAYRKQRGLNSVVLIPGNMYGEYDNFRMRESHVVPALIRRFSEARRSGAKQIVVWGTGAPVRDFVYAGDIAAVFPYFIDHYNSSEPVNLSSGTSTPIRGLAEAIHRLTHFDGQLIWDASKPDGQMVKIFDVSRMRKLGLECPTTLEDGLRKTIDWFESHYETRGDGLRLDGAAA